MLLLQWVFFPSFMATSESLCKFLTQTKEYLMSYITPLLCLRHMPVTNKRLFNSYALLVSLQTVFGLVQGNEDSFSSEIQS